MSLSQATLVKGEVTKIKKKIPDVDSDGLFCCLPTAITFKKKGKKKMFTYISVVFCSRVEGFL